MKELRLSTIISERFNVIPSIIKKVLLVLTASTLLSVPFAGKAQATELNQNTNQPNCGEQALKVNTGPTEWKIVRTIKDGIEENVIEITNPSFNPFIGTQLPYIYAYDGMGGTGELYAQLPPAPMCYNGEPLRSDPLPTTPGALDSYELLSPDGKPIVALPSYGTLVLNDGRMISEGKYLTNLPSVTK